MAILSYIMFKGLRYLNVHHEVRQTVTDTAQQVNHLVLGYHHLSVISVQITTKQEIEGGKSTNIILEYQAHCYRLAP